MDVLLNEPYYSGSHKYWADNLVKYSSHNIHLYAMKGKHWKWRLQGAAIYLANKLITEQLKPDLIICSSMMDVSVYKSLCATVLSDRVPIVYYMHENQLTYPYSKNETRNDEDFNYGFINYKSCLAADHIIFNSAYHRDNFFDALDNLLIRLPDYSLRKSIQGLRDKSSVISVGIDVHAINAILRRDEDTREHIATTPTLLWNSRWDSDKNPQLFLDLCEHLKDQGIEFNLILAGQKGNLSSSVYAQLKKNYSHQILADGFVTAYADYIKLLDRATILPVTSDHDFYGISVMEAILVGVCPILPENKVYEEFISPTPFPELFYQGRHDFFEKVKSCLTKTNHSSLAKVLASQDIHKVMSQYDLYIMDKCNV